MLNFGNMFRRGIPIIACLLSQIVVTELDYRYELLSPGILFYLSLFFTLTSILFTIGYIIYWKKIYPTLSNRKKLLHLIKISAHIGIVLLNGIITFGLYQLLT